MAIDISGLDFGTESARAKSVITYSGKRLIPFKTLQQPFTQADQCWLLRFELAADALALFFCLVNILINLCPILQIVSNHSVYIFEFHRRKRLYNTFRCLAAL